MIHNRQTRKEGRKENHLESFLPNLLMLQEGYRSIFRATGAEYKTVSLPWFASTAAAAAAAHLIAVASSHLHAAGTLPDVKISPWFSRRSSSVSFPFSYSSRVLHMVL
jgi:hypothetical protein